MTFSKWVALRGRGAKTQLMFATGLAYGTIVRAEKGLFVGPVTARKISKATDGQVPVKELLYPNGEIKAWDTPVKKRKRA